MSHTPTPKAHVPPRGRTGQPLTDLRIRNVEPRDDGKPLKLADGGGLSLWVLPSGKYWRWKYRFGGKERLLALGVYPEVSAREARQLRDDAKRQLHNGIDPGATRRAAKAKRLLGGEESFAGIAREWLALQEKSFTAATLQKAVWMFEQLLFPYIGTRPIKEVTAPELLAVVRRIEARGAYETAHRVKARAGQVFRYAIATGRAERDPAADLRGALAPIVVTHRAALTEPTAIGGLLRAIDSYKGYPVTVAALKLAPLVFVRPGELRAAEWSEVNLETAEWRIPAARMKMRREHIVPLSTQAVAILREELQPLTGRGRYLFPSVRSPKRPMSEVTVLAALRRMGYGREDMTGHGFRALASTRLNEMGWPPDVIERQLAHAERNKVRAAYNRAQRLDERRQMMQAWADYLDKLRNVPRAHRALELPVPNAAGALGAGATEATGRKATRKQH